MKPIKIVNRKKNIRLLHSGARGPAGPQGPVGPTGDALQLTTTYNEGEYYFQPVGETFYQTPIAPGLGFGGGQTVVLTDGVENEVLLVNDYNVETGDIDAVVVQSSEPGYITNNDITLSLSGAPGPEGPQGPGIPVGGSTGQVLAKVDSTDYNVEWTSVSGTGDVVGPSSSVAGHFSSFADTSGKLLQDSGVTFSNDPDLSGGDDQFNNLLTTQYAVKQYVDAHSGGGQAIYDIVVEDGDDINAKLSTLTNYMSVFIHTGSYPLTANLEIPNNCVITGESENNTNIVLNGFNINIIGNTTLTNLFIVNTVFGEQLQVNGYYNEFKDCNFYSEVEPNHTFFHGSHYYTNVDSCSFYINQNNPAGANYICASMGENFSFTNNYIEALNINNTGNWYDSFIATGNNAYIRNNKVRYSFAASDSALFYFGYSGSFDNNIVEPNTYNENFGYVLKGNISSVVNNTISAEASVINLNTVQTLTNNRIGVWSNNPNPNRALIYIDGGSNSQISDNIITGNFGNDGLVFSSNVMGGFYNINSNTFQNLDTAVDLSNVTPTQYITFNIVGNNFYGCVVDTIADNNSVVSQQDSNLGVRVDQNKKFYRMKNESGITIELGSPVFTEVNISGEITIKNESDGNSDRWLGVATEQILDGNYGWVQTSGECLIAIMNNAYVGLNSIISVQENLVLSNYVFEQITNQRLKYADALEEYMGGGDGSGVYLLKAYIYPQVRLLDDLLGQIVYDIIINPGDDIASIFASLSGGESILIRGYHALTADANITASGVAVYGEGKWVSTIDTGAYQFGATNGSVEFYNLGILINNDVNSMLNASGGTIFDNCRITLYPSEARSQLFVGSPFMLQVRNCYISIDNDNTTATTHYIDLISSYNAVFENNFIQVAKLNNNGAATIVLGVYSVFSNNHLQVDQVDFDGSVLINVNGNHCTLENNLLVEASTTSHCYPFLLTGQYLKFANNTIKCQSNAIYISGGGGNRVIEGNTFECVNSLVNYDTIIVADPHSVVISNNTFYGGSSVISGIKAISGYDMVINSNTFDAYEYGISFDSVSPNSRLVATSNKFENIVYQPIESVYGNLRQIQSNNYGVRIQDDKIFYLMKNVDSVTINEFEPVYTYIDNSESGLIGIQSVSGNSNAKYCGVAIENIPFGYMGWIQVSGEGLVKVQPAEAVSAGEYLVQSVGDGAFIPDLYNSNFVHAQLLENIPSAGVANYRAIIYPESKVINVGSGGGISFVSPLPEGGNNGDLVYETDDNTIYMWADGFWAQVSVLPYALVTESDEFIMTESDDNIIL